MDAVSRSLVRLPLAPRLALLLGMTLSGYLSMTCVPPELSMENYQRIEKGMSERQVEALLWAPAGDYGWWWVSCGPMLRENWEGEESYRRTWVTKDGWIDVGFTEDGQACSKTFDGPGRSRGRKRARQRTLWDWLFNRVTRGQGGIVFTSF